MVKRYLWGWHAMSNTYMKTGKMKLTIKTPTSIREPYELNNRQYLYDDRKKVVYYIDEVKLCKLLERKGKLEEFVKFLQADNKKLSTIDWLKANLKIASLDAPDVKAIFKASTKQGVKVTGATDKPAVARNTIFPALRDARGNCYIPGSSIKGLVRSAILFKLLNDDEAFRNRVRERIESSMRGKSIDKDVLTKADQMLEDALLLMKGQDGKLLDGSLASVMRGIQCSDTMSSSNVRTEILQKIDITQKREGATKLNPLSVFRECLLPDSTFEFAMSLDTRYTSNVGIHSIEDMVGCLQDFSNYLNSLMRGAFKEQEEEYKLFAPLAKEASNGYLGGNTSFLHKTLLAIIFKGKEHKQMRYEFIKNLLHQSFGARPKMAKEDAVISPRVLKCTRWNGKYWLVGGVHIGKYE